MTTTMTMTTTTTTKDPPQQKANSQKQSPMPKNKSLQLTQAQWDVFLTEWQDVLNQQTKPEKEKVRGRLVPPKWRTQKCNSPPHHSYETHTALQSNTETNRKRYSACLLFSRVWLCY
jgi:hypothetical protein